MSKLEELLTELETNDRTRCLILTGSGRKAFVSGGDLREFHTLTSAKEVQPMADRMLSILRRVEKLPCWTIASINGPAYGGGWEIMLAFDFRIAVSEATFGFTQGKFYLPPGWGGLTRLVECVGRSTALRWLAEARTIDAETARRHHLINRICPPGELENQSRNWAEQISQNDRAFIRNLKNGALRVSKSRWKAIEAEIHSFAEFWDSDLHRRRVEKFLNRKES